MKKVLTIAGSDCSGGAGIQADIKTITAYKMYAMSAITALTSQNTLGVHDVLNVTPDFVGKQLDSIFNDIEPDSVKIGMVFNKEIINIIAEKLSKYKARKIVLDPVMVSTSGSKLLVDDAIDILISTLMPLAHIITPNIPEAECLSGFTIKTKEDMTAAAKKINTFYNGAILIKGGHLEETCDDLLYVNGNIHWFEGERVDNSNTHGTGCTLSSAIACNLANCSDVYTSILNAKEYINGALKANLNLGNGRGPLNHCWNL